MTTKDLSVGETGRLIRVSGVGFDMSANTELILVFTKPDCSQVSKTKSGGEVNLGLVDVDDDDLGPLLANQYVEYITEVGFLDQYGTPWKVCLTFINTNTTPTQNFEGVKTSFPVLKACDEV